MQPPRRIAQRSFGALCASFLAIVLVLDFEYPELFAQYMPKGCGSQLLAVVNDSDNDNDDDPTGGKSGRMTDEACVSSCIESFMGSRWFVLAELGVSATAPNVSQTDARGPPSTEPQ